MFRDLFRFLKDKVNLSWKMTGRLILLAVYGEEHEADGAYPITNALSKEHFAKRKMINPLKPVELILTAVSLSLNKLMRVGDKKLSFPKALGYGLKSLAIDLPLFVLKLFSSPANTIIRSFRNFFQDISPLNLLSAFFSRPKQNNISRFLFNSSKTADVFPLHKMNTRYVLLSFVGADPVCPPDDLVQIARTRAADAANLTGQVAQQVGHWAGNVQQAAMGASVAATAAAGVMPEPVSGLMSSVAGGAAGLALTAEGAKRTAQTTHAVANQVEAQLRCSR